MLYKNIFLFENILKYLFIHFLNQYIKIIKKYQKHINLIFFKINILLKSTEKRKITTITPGSNCHHLRFTGGKSRRN